MTIERQMDEMANFNALTPEDAKRILDAAEGQRPAFRSCWYCNGAHDRLKSVDVLLCFACGVYYLEGFPAHIVAMRAESQPITEAEMQPLIAALERRL